MTIENQVIELIAADRIDIPISSMSGKLKRQKTKIAEGIDLSAYDCNFEGNRVYARVESRELMKARGMRDGIEEYCKKFPQQGKILNGIIEEERVKREKHLYFGMHDSKKLTADDYMNVMTNLGFTEATSRDLYPELMDISRNLSKKRDEERSILVG